MELAVKSMTGRYDKYAAEILGKYRVHGCTDVTGFGFLAHLCEMLGDRFSAEIDQSRIPYIPQCPDYAEEFYLTAAGQRNRNHVKDRVKFENVSFAMEEILFDATETSGGLLASICREDGEKALAEIGARTSCAIVGEITEKKIDSAIVR